MFKRSLLAFAILSVCTLPASSTDTVTNTTVSNTVSSSSNTVSSSSNTVSNTTSSNTTSSNTTGSTVIDKAPATASSPSVVVNNSDVCVSGVSGAVQTSVFGVSGGATVRDKNCERLKLARSLYGMGLKVAGVSLLCQDVRVFDAMMEAGKPCPFEGQIGTKAKASWSKNPMKSPQGSQIQLAAIKKAEIEEQKRLEAEEEDNIQ